MILLHKHLAVSAKEGMQIKSVKNKKRKTIRLPFYKSLLVYMQYMEQKYLPDKRP